MTQLDVSAWKVSKAKEFCLSVRDGTHDSPKFVEVGYPLVTSKHLKDGGLNLESAELISQSDFDEINKRSKVDQWDVIFTMIGTIGEVYLVAEEEPKFAIKNVGLFKCGSLTKAKWLYYWFKNPATKREILQVRRGVSQQYIPLGSLRDLEIKYPASEETMLDIVGRVAALDELIENNRRRIALLEQSARLLYREWFVQLRFPGHEHVKVVDGVPEGWEVACLSDCANVEDGDWIESKDQGGDDYRLLQVSNVGVDSFVETGNFRFVTSETFRRLNCREVVPGQILVSRMPDPIGRAWLVTKMPWKMITAVDVAIVEPKTDRVTPHYLIQHLNSPTNLELSKQHATGATRLRISRRSLCALLVLIPPLSLQRSFGQLIEDGYRMRSNLDSQIGRLTEARDLLLPRLMSGDLVV